MTKLLFNSIPCLTLSLSKGLEAGSALEFARPFDRLRTRELVADTRK